MMVIYSISVLRTFLNNIFLSSLMIEAILFDAEGVVIDSETIWDKGQEIFLKRKGVNTDIKKLKLLLTGQSMIDGVRIMQELYGFSGDPKDLANERIEIIQELFKTRIDYIPGFKEFYSNLKGSYKTCISTSMNRTLLKDVDARLGLNNLFDHNVFSIDDVRGLSKPDPAIFLYSAEKLGVSPDRCMVIEDSPHGITAAKKAGMYCVGITTTYPYEILKEANQMVSSFSEIRIQ